MGGGRWGRGRFSKRSASPPDPLSRRVAGNRLGSSVGLAHPCECGRSTIGSVEVTAADRAVVTVQHTQYSQKASPERGGARRAGGGVHPPSATRPRRLCHPPWTHSPHKKSRLTLRRNQLRRNNTLKRQPLFGREGSGGRGASLREAASPPRISRYPPRLLGREREGGDFSTEKSPPSQMISSTHSISAIASISQRTFLGRALTAQQLRAGLLTKCFA